MFRIFNMLIQNLTNLGNRLNEATLNDKFIDINFTDDQGNVYSMFIRKVDKEETENGN